MCPSFLFQMPTHESESSNSLWKPSSPALSSSSSGKISLNGRPPSCPTPDYDTSSSLSASSAAVSLITLSKNSVNSNNKPMINPQSRLTTTNATKSTAAASQTTSKNADNVEMQSIESFILTNPQSPKPKPPETYFVPVRSKKKPQHSRQVFYFSKINLLLSISDPCNKCMNVQCVLSSSHSPKSVWRLYKKINFHILSLLILQLIVYSCG